MTEGFFGVPHTQRKSWEQMALETLVGTWSNTVCPKRETGEKQETMEGGLWAGRLCWGLSDRNGESSAWSRVGYGKEMSWALRYPQGSISRPKRGRLSHLCSPGRPRAVGNCFSDLPLRKHIIKQVHAIALNLIFFFFFSELFTNRLLLVMTLFVLRTASLWTLAFYPGETEWPWEGKPCGQDTTGLLPGAGDGTRRP